MSSTVQCDGTSAAKAGKEPVTIQQCLSPGCIGSAWSKQEKEGSNLGLIRQTDSGRRLFLRGPGRAIRQRQKPDLAALRRLADALELHEIRALVRPLVQELRQLLMAQDVVERERGDRLCGNLPAEPERQSEQRSLGRPHGSGGQNLRVTLPVTSRRVP